MHLPDWAPQYAGMTGLTALGALARGKRWVDSATGKFIWARFLTEASTAAGLAVVAIGAGTYWHIEPAALSAICVGCGWLGPDTAWSLVFTRFGGGSKDGPRNG